MTYTAPDGQTRYVVPAPADDFYASGTAWYELQLGPDERRIDLIAFDSHAAEVGRAEARWVSDLTLDVRVTGPQAQIRIGISPAVGQGDALAQGTANGEAFTVFTPAVGPESTLVSGGITLAPAESDLVKTWSGLAHSLTMLALALDAGKAEDTGSCAGCMVELAGEAALAAACADGVLPACGAFLVTWPHFVKHCTGACA